MDKYGRPVDHTEVHIQQQPPTYMAQTKQSWSWCSIVTSTISLCCCSLMGGIGLLCAVLSYTDHKVGDYERHKTKRCWSLCCSISAIVIGCLAIAAILVLVFAFPGIIYGYASAINIRNPYAG
ncbi:unnamed protein product [Owenia fusiformis]|uniref:Uncharacterized protein n=1 Tax=Owenia fusiformis TaxID=6347 RepID=A0A8S4ND07_OWEFU|nr:unnamed protein product [Owenia fusiformis]